MLKKTIAVVGILALSAGLANAQNKKLSPDRLLGGTVESLQKELDLTAEQVTQVEPFSRTSRPSWKKRTAPRSGTSRLRRRPPSPGF